MNTSNYSLLAEMKFLIVDDHDFMRRIVCEALISRGVGQIQRASNGAEALNLLNKIGSQIDFIISDFNMPNMNGLELLKAIRTGAIRVNRDIPVIMLSGFDDELLLRCAMKLDANGFIGKPVSRSELLTRMDRIVMNEFVVKDPDQYMNVTIPDIDGTFGEPGRGAMAGDVSLHPERKVDGRPVSLGDVQVGSILTADLLTTNNNLLLEANTRITGVLIELLKDSQKVTGINKLMVKKP